VQDVKKTMIISPGDTPALHLDSHTRNYRSKGATPADEVPQLDEVIKNTVDFIEAEFRRLNPELPADTAICGGCALNVANNIAVEMLNRAHASDNERIAFHSGLLDITKVELERLDPIGALLGNLLLSILKDRR
jgi:hypothetical protein